MHGAAQEALQLIAEINTGYRTPDETPSPAVSADRADGR